MSKRKKKQQQVLQEKRYFQKVYGITILIALILLLTLIATFSIKAPEHEILFLHLNSSQKEIRTLLIEQGEFNESIIIENNKTWIWRSPNTAQIFKLEFDENLEFTSFERLS